MAASAVIAIALALAIPATPTAAQAPAPINVEMSDYAFSPKEFTVPMGAQRFVLKNTSPRKHNFTVETPGSGLRTPDVDAGATFETTFAFSQPGTYNVICELPTHATRGMVGKITVLAADAPAAAPAQTTAPAAGAPAQSGAAPTAAAPAAPAVQTGGQTGASGGVAAPAAPQTTSAGLSPSGMPMLISLAIHIPAAITWLGIVLYDAIVVAVPYLSAQQRGNLLRRPRWLMLATIPLFMVTGIYQTIYNPLVTITDIPTLERFRAETTYGLALFWKHGFVMFSMAFTLAVTFWFAPRLRRLGAIAGQDAASATRLPALLAWANVAACVALLGCVAVIVYQLH